MKCTYCDNDLTVEMIRDKGCGGCIGGCRKIHCPYCGQENPILPEYLTKLMKDKSTSGTKGEES